MQPACCSSVFRLFLCFFGSFFFLLFLFSSSLYFLVCFHFDYLLLVRCVIESYTLCSGLMGLHQQVLQLLSFFLAVKTVPMGPKSEITWPNYFVFCSKCDVISHVHLQIFWLTSSPCQIWIWKREGEKKLFNHLECSRKVCTRSHYYWPWRKLCWRVYASSATFIMLHALFIYSSSLLFSFASIVHLCNLRTAWSYFVLFFPPFSGGHMCFIHVDPLCHVEDLGVAIPVWWSALVCSRLFSLLVRCCKLLSKDWVMDMVVYIGLGTIWYTTYISRSHVVSHRVRVRSVVVCLLRVFTSVLNREQFYCFWSHSSSEQLWSGLGFVLCVTRSVGLKFDKTSSLTFIVCDATSVIRNG